MPAEKIRIEHESRLLWLEVVENLGDDLCAKLGFSDDDRFAVRMALREGLNNAMLHGNGRDERKRVEVLFLPHGDQLEIRIKDQGPGFEPGKLPDPLTDENRLKASGRGVFLIRSYMDRVDLARAHRPGGEVRMFKVKQPVAGGTQK